MDYEFGPELAKALVAAQSEFSAVAKTGTNPHFKSKFAPLNEVVQTTSPVLARHKLAVTQFIGATADGRDTLVTILVHESGQSIGSTMLLHLPKNDPQGQGSAVTYARRYAYMAALGLVADEDDDANRAVAAKPERSALSDDHKRIADLLKAVPSDSRKAFVEDAIGREGVAWKDLTADDLAKVELALMSDPE